MSHVRFVLALAAGLVAACSPAARSDRPPLVDATAESDVAANQVPWKVDILWVVDQSPDGVYGQRQLAARADEFLARLGPDIDMRTAVVTVQQLADLDSDGQVKKVGQFLTGSASPLSATHVETVRRPCSHDAHCVKDSAFHDFPTPKNGLSTQCTQNRAAGKFPALPDPDGPGGWRCSSTFDPKYIVNDDCSVNSFCWYACKTDQECRAAFEPDVPAAQQSAACYLFDAGGSGGCMFPLPTAGCLPCKASDRVVVDGKLVCRPECFDGKDLLDGCRPPGVLQGKDLADLRCRLVVGPSQTPASRFEGGFRAAWKALDPAGPHCPKFADGQPTAACQHSQLVRPDALLVLVFVTDDDDCSMPVALNPITVNFWDQCQLLGDAAGGDLHLNEAHCMNSRLKDPKVVCPFDCRDLAPGSADRAVCDQAAAAAMAASVQTDFRIAPVAEYVSLFKSLKSDPAQIVVATIVGDSLTDSLDVGHGQTEARHLDRVAHEAARLRNIAPGQNPSICSTPGVDAEFGSRYIELAEAFGKGGFQANLCTPGGLGQVMLDLADHIRARAEALHAR